MLGGGTVLAFFRCSTARLNDSTNFGSFQCGESGGGIQIFFSGILLPVRSSKVAEPPA